jgi:hypothetical protein
MSGDKQLDEKVKELDKVYEEMVDSFELDNIAWHYRAWIDVFRKEQKEAAYRAKSDEEIAALERAVEDFEAVYEAEKAEAEKMPLSWAEAERLRKVFDGIFHKDFATPPADARREN